MTNGRPLLRPQDRRPMQESEVIREGGSDRMERSSVKGYEGVLQTEISCYRFGKAYRTNVTRLVKCYLLGTGTGWRGQMSRTTKECYRRELAVTALARLTGRKLQYWQSVIDWG